MKPWKVYLTATAEQDFRDIVLWTIEHFGTLQARQYALALQQTIDDLAAGPHTPGIKGRDDIGKGLYTLPIARRGRKARHFLVVRIRQQDSDKTIDILRILHQAMDLRQNLIR